MPREGLGDRLDVALEVLVKRGVADDRDLAGEEILEDRGVRERGAVRRDEQVRGLEVGRRRVEQGERDRTLPALAQWLGEQRLRCPAGASPSPVNRRVSPGPL